MILEQNIHFVEMQLDEMKFCDKLLYMLAFHQLCINNFSLLYIVLPSHYSLTHVVSILFSVSFFWPSPDCHAL